MVRLFSREDERLQETRDQQERRFGSRRRRVRRASSNAKRDEVIDVASELGNMHGCGPSARSSRAGCTDFPRHH